MSDPSFESAKACIKTAATALKAINDCENSLSLDVLSANFDAVNDANRAMIRQALQFSEDRLEFTDANREAAESLMAASDRLAEAVRNVFTKLSNHQDEIKVGTPLSNLFLPAFVNELSTTASVMQHACSLTAREHMRESFLPPQRRGL